MRALPGVFSLPCRFCLLLLWLVISAVSPAAQESKEIITLEPNVTIEKELTMGQSHNYLIKLKAGQAAQIEVEQRGINVFLNILGPDDKFLLFEDKWWLGKQGVEKVMIVAETAGDYQLWIWPQGAVNQKNLLPGKYEVRLTELRPATDQDRLLYNSRILHSEATLQVTAIIHHRESALVPNKAEEWLNKYRDLGDYHEIGGLLSAVGDTYEVLRQYKKAVEYREQEIAMWQSRGNQPDLAYALERIASTYYLAGEHQKAVFARQSALAILHNLGNRRQLQIAYRNFGSVSLRLRNEQQALDNFNQALAIARELNDSVLIINELSDLAEAYSWLGAWDQAFDYHNQALIVARASNNQRSEAVLLSDLTTDIAQMEGFRDRGELLQKRNSRATQIIELLEKSRTLYHALNDPFEADPLSILAVWYAMNGDRGTALAAVEKVLTLSQTMPSAPKVAITINASFVYSLLENQQQAFELIARAYREFNGTLDETAIITSALAQRLRADGKLNEAREKIEEAINVKESLRGRLSDQEYRIIVSSDLARDYEFYVDLLMQLHEQKPEQRLNEQAFLATERARARSLLDLLVEARAGIRSGVDEALLERERTLQQKINSLTPRPNDPQKNKQAEAVPKELTVALDELRTVRAQIRHSSPHFADLTEPQTPDLAEIQKQLLDTDTMLLSYSLGEKHSFLWAITANSFTSYQLPSRDEINSTARRVYELLTSRQRLSGLAPDARQKQIAEADEKYQTEAAKLSQMLLSPVAAQLGHQRLLIVAPEVLQYLPFAALPQPGAGGWGPEAGEKRNQPQTSRPQPLIVDHEIIVLPSVSVLMLLRRELAERQPAPKAVAVLADPVFEASDPRVRNSAQITARRHSPTPTAASMSAVPSALDRSLRSFPASTDRAKLTRLILSRDEAEAIAAAVPAGDRLKALDFKASRANAMSSELSQYRIVHFATHGLLNAQHPELSGLVFSLVDEQGNPQDGFLRLHEIYNLKLPAELVVLSACQTGLGKEIKGEGLIGLTRGFMYAGAARVVASLWRVDDYATSVLMKKFYRGMLKDGLRPAAALRKAQIEMWKQKQSPFYWGAFVLQGEWK